MTWRGVAAVGPPGFNVDAVVYFWPEDLDAWVDSGAGDDTPWGLSSSPNEIAAFSERMDELDAAMLAEREPWPDFSGGLP